MNKPTELKLDALAERINTNVARMEKSQKVSQREVIEATTNSPAAQPRGYQRRHCSKCGDGLGFSESDPCSKCGTETQPEEGELLPCPLCKQPLEVMLNGRAVCRNSGSRQSPHDGCLMWLEGAQLHIETWQALNTRADLPRATAGELDVWDRLNERRHELIYLKRQQGFLEERDEADFNALQYVAGLVREVVAGQPFQVNDNSAITAPRATGETTVEAALAELREMFPDHYRRIETIKVDGPHSYSFVMVLVYEQRDRPLNGIINESAPTLADCMAQVRTATQTKAESGATRTEGEGEKS